MLRIDWTPDLRTCRCMAMFKTRPALVNTVEIEVPSGDVVIAGYYKPESQWLVEDTSDCPLHENWYVYNVIPDGAIPVLMHDGQRRPDLRWICDDDPFDFLN